MVSRNFVFFYAYRAQTALVWLDARVEQLVIVQVAKTPKTRTTLLQNNFSEVQIEGQ